MLNRRQALKGAMTGMLTLWTSRWARAGQQEAPAGRVDRLNDRITVVDGGGTNVVALSTANGLVLVDSGHPSYGDRLVAALNGLAPNSRVHTLFNTHYHLDQTGNNALVARSGATIIAHDRTRQWMSTNYWLPDERRYEKSRPQADRPTQTFVNTGSMEAGGERIDYGYLVSAHSAGDIYVYFKDSNVLVVGGVASPVNDPELDWIAGAWIGGRVDAMDRLLEIGNERTRVVPGSGPVMTYAELQAERELMEMVRQRLFTRIRAGEGAQEMLKGGALDGLKRTWKDPYKFLYSAARGMWGNHNKLDRDVV
jgi:glyoxylase-like metal-dependent hydrolase (beta-lactamase superfamily II)